MQVRPRLALTVAGTDPTGGAGIQGDCRAFTATSVHGLSVITAIVAQGTRGVRSVAPLAAALVREQLEVLLADVTPDAAKTGMLATGEIVLEIAAAFGARSIPLVVDPVLVSSSGARLLEATGVRTLDHLFASAALVTPNADELAALLDDITAPRDAEGLSRAAERLFMRFGVPVLATGGHLDGDPVDVLVDHEGTLSLPATRIVTSCTRGTGCTLSAAITGYLAHGDALRTAVQKGRVLLLAALADALPIGEGASPTDPLRRLLR